MKGMILSAGYGTRLKPMTDKIPKALVAHRSVPMINYQIERLKSVGIDEIIINAHHLAPKIIEYFEKNKFDVKINIIVEGKILGTGGGILNAGKYFINEDYFIVINVDVDTDFHISELIDFHRINRPFASILVQKRNSGKYLEFTDDMILKGRWDGNSSENNLFAFNGIQIISGDLYSYNIEKKYIDIFDLYGILIKDGYEIRGYDAGDSYFKDLGKLDNIIR